MSKTWVLLRGLGRDKRHFGEFLNLFKQAFKDDHVITIDTLGNGDFRHLKSPTTISEYTNHCRQILATMHTEQASSNQPIALVALSLGGMVAMDWASRFPEQIQSLTIINTSAANLTPPHRRMKLPTLARLLYAFVINRQPKAIETAIVTATSNEASNKVMTNVIDQWTNIRLTGVTTTSNMIKQLIAAATFKVSAIEQLAIDNKLLILYSEHDHIVNHQASRDLQRFLQGQLVKHPSAGHDLPLDAPDWVITQIKQHLLP